MKKKQKRFETVQVISVIINESCHTMHHLNRKPDASEVLVKITNCFVSRFIQFTFPVTHQNSIFSVISFHMIS